MLLNLLWIVLIFIGLLLIIFHLPHPWFTAVFRRLFIWFYRFEVEGMENYPALDSKEPLVIVANHTSFLDGTILGVFLPEKLTFAVSSEFCNKWWAKIFLKYGNIYPIDVNNPMVTKDLIEITRKGNRFVIFPEGRITVTGALMKIYEGPGLIADKAGAKILPIRINGAQYSPFSRLKGKVRIQWFPKITMTILPAQQFKIPAEIRGRQRREVIGLKLYELMTNMMFASSKNDSTLFQALIDASRNHGRKINVLEDIKQQPMNYQRLIAASFFLANKLRKITKAKENIGLLLPNSLALMTTFFGLQAIGRVPALLNYTSGAENIISMCRVANIQTLISSRQFIEQGKYSALIEKLQQAGINLCYLEDFKKTGKFAAALASLFPEYYYHHLHDSTAASPRDSITPPRGATTTSSRDSATTSSRDLIAGPRKNPNKSSQPAVILFTSGSEAKPKAVVLSHQNLIANCRQMGSVIDLNSNDKIFNPLPLFHSFGLTTATLLPLFNGVKIFLYPSPLHYRVIPEMVYSENSTILFGTDAFLAGYASHAHPYDFYSLRYVFIGGEHLRESTRQLWAENFGLRILAGYGTTETSPVIACNTPMTYKPDTVGKFLPGITYRLEPVEGVEDAGKLIVSGPNVMLGYYLNNNPGELQPPLNHEYDTGDIVSIDDQGYVTIKGRLKRFAKIAGEMLSLTAIENYISELWPDYLHAVIAADDEKRGQRLVLITTYNLASRELLLEYYHNISLPELYLPKQIYHANELAMLANGKIDYNNIGEMINKKT